MALGAFSYLLRMDGKKEVADYYDKLNEGFVEYWMKNASVRYVDNTVHEILTITSSGCNVTERQ